MRRDTVPVVSDSIDPNVLRIGYVPGVTLTKWRTRWAERLTASLEAVEVTEIQVHETLVSGEIDMCFVRLPIDREGLHAIPLYEEQMVAWVNKEHPIAAFDSVTVADLAEETVLTEVDQVAIDRVNAGAVLLVPLAIARSASRRDLVHRPVTDAPPTQMVLAWRTDNEHPLIEEFIGIVRGRTANSSRTDRERGARDRREPRKLQGRAARTRRTRRD